MTCCLSPGHLFGSSSNLAIWSDAAVAMRTQKVHQQKYPVDFRQAQISFRSLLYDIMSKRRGATRQRQHRTIDAKRLRWPERNRIYRDARLRGILNLPPNPDYNNAIGASTDAQSFSLLKLTLQRDAELDPELYCASPVTDDGGECTEF